MKLTGFFRPRGTLSHTAVDKRDPPKHMSREGGTSYDADMIVGRHGERLRAATKALVH